MIFTAQKTEVLKATSKLVAFQDFFLKLKGPQLTIAAEDSDVSCSITVGVADGKDDGDVVLPAQLFHGTVKMGGQTFTLATQGDKATIATLGGRYCLPSDKEKELSNPKTRWHKLCTLSAEQIEDITSKTLFAVGEHDSRAYLNGVLLRFTSQELRAFATNGKQLIKCIYKVSSRIAADVIVTPKALSTLAKIAEGEVGVFVDSVESPSRIKFQTDGATVVVRLIEVQHPDYEALIPKQSGKQVTAIRQELLSAVRRATLYSGTVSMTIRNRQIVLTATNECGSSEETIPCSNDFEGRILLGGAYLVEMLEHFENETVSFEIRDPASAVVIKDESSHVVMLLMPMKRGTSATN